MPFSNVSSVNIPPALIAEQDFFYWPCISGEKYAPAITAGGAVSSGTVGYSSSGLYPVVGFTGTSASGATSKITWPLVPAFKYTGSSFAGYTIRCHLILAASFGSVNGCRLYFNSTDNILFADSTQIQGTWGTNGTYGSFGSGTYECIFTFAANGNLTATLNGTTIYSDAAGGTQLTAAPRLSWETAVGNAGFPFSAFISQLQITYS